MNMQLRRFVLSIFIMGCLACNQSHPAKSFTLPNKSPDTATMVKIPGGTFNMGTNDPAFADAHPVHQVTVSPFLMDEHEVTNAQFERFVNATHYITGAEIKPLTKDYPGVPEANLLAGSAVFTPPAQQTSLNDPTQWWLYVAGANWRHPEGPSSNLIGRQNYPVVQICYEDAMAYCKWVGKRLPTEAEWEFAAKGGKGDHPYYWGDDFKPRGKWMANIYEGDFPSHNTGADGYIGLAPVKSFPKNAYGLYDMEGNAWEWCHDFYRPDYYLKSPKLNPQGPPNSYDPEAPGTIVRVQRGGSFLCSDQYCIRYKAGARGKGEVKSASNNLGFRCVKDIVK
jgi:formylglycine-generating enzyme required for sulfatase activity